MCREGEWGGGERGNASGAGDRRCSCGGSGNADSLHGVVFFCGGFSGSAFPFTWGSQLEGECA